MYFGQLLFLTPLGFLFLFWGLFCSFIASHNKQLNIYELTYEDYPLAGPSPTATRIWEEMMSFSTALKGRNPSNMCDDVSYMSPNRNDLYFCSFFLFKERKKDFFWLPYIYLK